MPENSPEVREEFLSPDPVLSGSHRPIIKVRFQISLSKASFIFSTCSFVILDNFYYYLCVTILDKMAQLEATVMLRLSGKHLLESFVVIIDQQKNMNNKH